jgi:hypothetical protein
MLASVRKVNVTMFEIFCWYRRRARVPTLNQTKFPFRPLPGAHSVDFASNKFESILLMLGRWRVTEFIGTMKPNLPPIGDFAARTPAHVKGHVGASTG